MPLDAPIRLGRFLADRDGRLTLQDNLARPTLDLIWHGRAVRMQVSGDAGGGGGRLALSAVVGRVPSTAGGGDGVKLRRVEALARLTALSAAMGAGWRLALLPDHRASIEAARDIALPSSAGALLTQVTCFLLDLAPYLDLLDESGLGMEPAGGPSTAGMENTCPG